MVVISSLFANNSSQKYIEEHLTEIYVSAQDIDLFEKQRTHLYW